MRPQTAEEAPGPGDSPGQAGNGHRPRHHEGRRWRARWLLVPAVALVVALVAARLAVGAPGPTLEAPSHERVVAGGPPLRLSWPGAGEAAVAVPKTGLLVASGPAHPVPVASLTKIMTAYVVLRDHPLGAGQDGPAITMGPRDVAFDLHDVAEGETTLKVAVGEQLTERQLLQGMLVHSAGNFAESLAAWDAGSVQAFVHKMNATARALRLSHTHYADVSGLDPGSVSTPSDQLSLAERALGDPAFDAVVAEPSVTLPLVGPEDSYTPFVGSFGVVGVKSGYTSAAGGCVVLAVHEHLGPPGTGGSRHALVLAAVTGQAGGEVLAKTAFDAWVLAGQVASHTVPVKALRRGEHLGQVTFDGVTDPVVSSRTVRVLATPGQLLDLRLRTRDPPPGASGGAVVGHATVVVGAQGQPVSLRLAHPLPGESLVHHLF